MKNLNDLLARRDTAQDFLAQSFFLYAGDKTFRDLEIDIRFEQREAHLPQRVVNVRLADRAVTAQVLEDVLKLIAELREHDYSFALCTKIPGSARVSRVGHRVLAIADFSVKIVSARRRNQHARRVLYPERPWVRYFLGVGDVVAPLPSTAKVQCASTFLPPDFASTMTLHLSRNFWVT